MNIKEFESFMLEKLNSINCEKTIKEAMAYSLISNGKYVRPLIFLCLSNNKNYSKKIYYQIMMLIECIHTYSLIHDDLPSMDDDKFRRGKLTNHLVFGEDIAILAGDALNTYAFELLATLTIEDSKKIKMIEILAKYSGVNSGMINGQVLDILSNEEVDLSYLEKLHFQKTACLIQVPILFALIMNDEEEKLNLGMEIGQLVGLVYQIYDDYLDLYGDEALLGKEIGKDRENNKKTYVDFYEKKELLELIEKYQNEINNKLDKLTESEEFKDLIVSLSTRSN